MSWRLYDAKKTSIRKQVFFKKNKIISIFEFHRRIIELGAGSGLLGLALLKYSEKIFSYTFTDYSSMILNLLQQNVLLNFSEDQIDVIQ